MNSNVLCLENVTKNSDASESNSPDNFVQTIEKVSIIFDRIKHGNPFEAHVLCDVLPHILNDFFCPSDIFTKVVGEFLSPQQKHAKLLSRVVFEVSLSQCLRNFSRTHFRYLDIRKCHQSVAAVPTPGLGRVQPVQLHAVVSHRNGDVVPDLLLYQCQHQHLAAPFLPVRAVENRKV